ncbi:MAG: SDR family NAD(P)-dependent oxidoreductase, partial [Kingella sp. (in: b-proteobacteria)]
MTTQNLNGQIALVTGASRGIGAAIANTLAQAGATVIGTATSESGAAAIAERLSQWGGYGRVLNASEDGAIENLIAAIEKDFGQLDILINNAGITRDNLLMRMKDDDWDAIMNVNLKSVYRASKAVLRGMMKRRFGRIITITSVVGTMG